ncbi:hypothetical protein HLH10_06375 [Acinetobacter sp. ANC 4277]|uniref:hypothetical protein n=1 Tax=Acinetobacter terrae TaxID=2731247 RepID=UPI0014900887|nr:hypothetical protein [Acinetobacter terrae]NNG75958.1 hypothetical protein [Acinetobacter terrae]
MSKYDLEKIMHNSSYMKAMRAVENSSYMKVIREMQTVLNTTRVSNYYVEIIEERISINDEIIGFVQKDNNELNEQSLFINTVLFSIYILTVNAQVPLDQLLVNLAQNILSSTLFLYLQYK